ncbi:hypothetical protein PR048_030635 [Dryococelus australis]|uniref:Uncharacterized protein n=1 Tax=Dryococelus australis TaxID=614101 RepID=A0ABQ9G9H1_9NEOP|nr:hypothetical protein PR048_030635 [Dryococelus australis]
MIDTCLYNGLKLAGFSTYTADYGIINFKYSLSYEPFHQLDLQRNKRGRPISLEISQILPKYRATAPINTAKRKDLLSLLPLIDSAYDGLYQSLATSERHACISPDLNSEEEDED